MLMTYIIKLFNAYAVNRPKDFPRGAGNSSVCSIALSNNAT